jgi:hypothetical protein
MLFSTPYYVVNFFQKYAKKGFSAILLFEAFLELEFILFFILQTIDNQYIKLND